MTDELDGYYWDRDNNLFLIKDDGTFELVSTAADMSDTVIALHVENAALRAEVMRLNAQYYEMDTYGCPDCNGDGEIRGETCFTCNGHGVLYTKPHEAAHA